MWVRVRLCMNARLSEDACAWMAYVHASLSASCVYLWVHIAENSHVLIPLGEKPLNRMPEPSVGQREGYSMWGLWSFSAFHRGGSRLFVRGVGDDKGLSGSLLSNRETDWIYQVHDSRYQLAVTFRKAEIIILVDILSNGTSHKCMQESVDSCQQPLEHQFSFWKEKKKKKH